MKIILIFLLMFSVESNNSYLLKQGTVVVTLEDVDSLILDIPTDLRNSVITNSRSLEKNIYHVLNMNIINEYVRENSLLAKENAFKDIQVNIDLPDEELRRFVEKLGYDKESILKIYEKYLHKKEILSAFYDYAKEKIDKNHVTELAHDYYVVNKKSYINHEKRSLHVIQISKTSEYAQNIDNILKDLISNPSNDKFSEYANKYSNDPSVKSNSGYLGAFKYQDLNYPFAKEIFNYDNTGIIEKYFEDRENFYIIKIEDITPKSVIPFDKIKEDLVSEIVAKQSNHFIQTVINQSNVKIDINEELAKQVFERYKVLLED